MKVLKIYNYSFFKLLFVSLNLIFEFVLIVEYNSIKLIFLKKYHKL
ncbi:hypothetical protein MARI151_10764 [Maribacter litoralis]|uniref:Uncharacterized protein n=1 Tax=Maribacter litoralis TaxID=2059726 RepID=A0A653NQE7_9FLAO|nr:hypothetical protein MARI151_10764 [Maribacter litoralis]